jgi:hypothetical protein
MSEKCNECKFKYKLSYQYPCWQCVYNPLYSDQSKPYFRENPDDDDENFIK